MAQITFFNKTTLNEITVCKDEYNIYISGERHSINDKNIHNFIWRISKAFPNIALYEELMEGVNYGSGDEIREAHKIFHRVDQFLKSKRSGYDFFQNSRGKGYRISDKWDVKEEDSNERANDLIIQTLSEIVNRSIDYANAWEIEHDQSGLSYIRAKSDYAMKSFREINALYWEILEHTSRKSNSIEILSLREPLFKMMTYILFWRVGDRLTDEQWRSDYEREIKLLMKQTAAMYRDI